MIHRDYIVRMLELFAGSLAKIFGLKEQKQFEEAVAEIDRTGEIFFGMDFKLIKLLSDTDLIRLLNSDGFLDSDKCAVLAALIGQEGEILALQGKPDESRARLVTALSLYMEAYLCGEKMRNRDTVLKIDSLIRQADTAEWPFSVKRKLLAYYESCGKFHKAEDTLFEFSGSDLEAVYDEGIAFFARLAARSDDELETGQLPRAEVLRGLEDFRKLFHSSVPKIES